MDTIITIPFLYTRNKGTEMLATCQSTHTDDEQSWDLNPCLF